jgi:hypothetical protein
MTRSGYPTTKEDRKEILLARAIPDSRQKNGSFAFVAFNVVRTNWNIGKKITSNKVIPL